MSRLLLMICGVAFASVAMADVDFDTQIIPIFTKSGCNAGSCHGSALGRGGFRLSLWGGDANVDYRSVVREFEGRRVNLAHPEKSLVLLKPTEELDHEGGYRLRRGSEGAALLKKWLSEGARRIRSRRLVRLDVTPASQLIEKKGDQVALSSRALFDTGGSEDVTGWTVFQPDDGDAVYVNKKGVATVKRPGQHTVIA